MTSLNLNIVEKAPMRPPHPAAGPAAAPGNSHILRFHNSERMLHWAIAIPFLVCFAMGVVLVVVYNPEPSRPCRWVFSWTHRLSGVALIVFPSLVARRSRGQARLHLYNIQQAWTWMRDDVVWLALMGLNAVNPKIKLPEQGKFNAAEKLNFMVLMGTYPLYVATGLLIWLTRAAVLSWILHVAMALFAAPLVCGHLYMALCSKSGRPGLQGMISGFVDRQWAKHHYRRWYREHHERGEREAAQ